MMRPMKLAGDKLLFGEGCLSFLNTLPTKRAFIVIGGSSMERNGILQRTEEYLHEAGAETAVFRGVEPDPSFDTVKRGAAAMLEFEPDLIVALGGGSAMDAAKAMWVYYEHQEMKSLEDVLTADPFPALRNKAKLCCIPSTAGTASEVSRSFVITDGGLKYGFGNMEMMPDIAILDPQVTISMPAHITAETGMDALTHALEALVSNRANYMSDVLCEKAILDIFKWLPAACADGADIAARENMLNASMIAGMAFTNVSLGIVHSIAHTVGGLFHVAHGLADAVILPFVMHYNLQNGAAAKKYEAMAAKTGKDSMAEQVRGLNRKLGIPSSLKEIIPDDEAFRTKIPEMAKLALADGCTKTNPVIPGVEEMCGLLETIYQGGNK